METKATQKKPRLSEATKPEMYKRFRDALGRDPHASNLVKYFVPRCDFRTVYTYAAIFVCDRGVSLSKRLKRYEGHLSDLRSEIRELEIEIAAEPIPSVAVIGAAGVRADHPADVHRALNDFFASNFASILRKKQTLAVRREQYHAVQRLLSTQRYGHGETWALFVVKEYLDWKAQAVAKGSDLAVIVRAVYVALGAEHQPDEELYAHDLLRKLNQFKRSCPEFVLAIRLETHDPAENIL